MGGQRDTITNIRNERKCINIIHMDMRMIAKEYYKRFYAHKFDNTDEIACKTKSARTHTEEIDNLNRCY